MPRSFSRPLRRRKIYPLRSLFSDKLMHRNGLTFSCFFFETQSRIGASFKPYDEDGSFRNAGHPLIWGSFWLRHFSPQRLQPSP